jgi:hypothetical protein
LLVHYKLLQWQHAHNDSFTTIKRGKTTSMCCFLVSIASNSKREKKMCKEVKRTNKEKWQDLRIKKTWDFAFLMGLGP